MRKCESYMWGVSTYEQGAHCACDEQNKSVKNLIFLEVCMSNVLNLQGEQPWITSDPSDNGIESQNKQPSIITHNRPFVHSLSVRPSRDALLKLTSYMLKSSPNAADTAVKRFVHAGRKY